MSVKKKVSSEFYDIVDPLSKALDGIAKDTKRVVETGIRIQSNFREVAIGLRRISRRTSMKMLSSALSFATPVDINNIVEDVTNSAITVYRFVKNSGVLPLYAKRLRYFKYEEQDLSEFLDDIESARDIIAEMEFDRIDMMYSIDVINGAESLTNAMDGLKSKSITGAKKLAETGIKLKGIGSRLPKTTTKEKKTASKSYKETQIEEVTATSEGMKERLFSIKEDWPEFKAAIDILCIRLEPLLAQLNKVLGVETSKKEYTQGKFEIYKDASGQFRFRLIAPNNEIIAVSEAYTRKGACIKGIESVKVNALLAKMIDRTK
jgi:uncharacterized protein YegP (UPF0339 family)